MTSRKSSSPKVIAVGTSEGPHAALSLPGDGNTENVEALIPMISDHFIDAKVRNIKQREWCYSNCLKFYIHLP